MILTALHGFLSIVAQRTASLGDHIFRHHGTLLGVQSSCSPRLCKL